MGSYIESSFDFVVVGGGNSGVVVASKLAYSEHRPRVLLIEAGGDNKRDEFRVPCERYTNVYVHPEVRFDYKTTAQDHLDGRTLKYLRGRGLGGSSIANFLAYIRGSASDYNVWADLVGDDSYKWENVIERYKEIEALHFEDDGDEDHFVKPVEGAHGYDGPLDLTLSSRKEWPLGTEILMKAARDFGWPINADQNSGNLVGMGMVTTTSYKGYRTTSASAFLSTPAENLTIWTDTSVHKVIFETYPTNGKPQATGVLLMDGREVRAKKEVVLSLGTIDTPKLLLLSGIGPELELQRLGIPCLVDHPGLGKELIDHCYVVLRWGATTDLSDHVAFASDTEGLAANRAEWLKSHSGPDATRNIANLIGFLKLDPQRCSFEELNKLSPMVQSWIRQPNVPQFEAFMSGTMPNNWDKSFGDEAFGIAVMLMNPQSRGTVTIASKDPTAMPLIDVNFLSHPYDRRTLIDAVREVLTFVKSKHLSKYIVSNFDVPETDSDEDIWAYLKKSIMSVLHGVGTVKMGHADDPTACVDTDMCLRGVDNLRVVDLSVCPVLTNNHTQSTAYLVGQIGWKKAAAKHNL